MVFCKDCKHVKVNPYWNWQCMHYESEINKKIVDVVSGIETIDHRFRTCYEMRDKLGDCGPDGWLFEEAEQAQLIIEAPKSI